MGQGDILKGLARQDDRFYPTGGRLLPGDNSAKWLPAWPAGFDYVQPRAIIVLMDVTLPEMILQRTVSMSLDRSEMKSYEALGIADVQS